MVGIRRREENETDGVREVRRGNNGLSVGMSFGSRGRVDDEDDNGDAVITLHEKFRELHGGDKVAYARRRHQHYLRLLHSKGIL